ncbi:MAG: hypothetical protein WD009_02005 [Phycisphaeraceae bacterium]
MPSRYEDLDQTFRGRLRPNRRLLDLAKSAFQNMRVAGGIRFLPVYGKSGSGKTCAANELATHLPEARVVTLTRDEIEHPEQLRDFLKKHISLFSPIELLIPVVDQYEENVPGNADVPAQFVEMVSLLDRGDLREQPMLFIWLTTSRTFQAALAAATERNKRILVDEVFEIEGPPKEQWPEIIEETFRFHNDEKSLADVDVIEEDLEDVARRSDTLGEAIERIGERLGKEHVLQDLSEYTVVMLWPVTDGQRIATVRQFTDPRSGYILEWGAWFRELNPDDRRTLPLRELNRVRLYFDVRLVPIAAADLQKVCEKRGVSR